MNSERSPYPGAPDPDLEEADYLLKKADELLKRRHTASRTTSAPYRAETDDDDLPVLTDIVDEGSLAGAAAPQTIVEQSDPGRELLAEALIGLDTEINREIESWLAKELPELIATELEQLTQQLKLKLAAQARATLLPTLSARIASRLESITAPPKKNS